MKIAKFESIDSNNCLVFECNGMPSDDSFGSYVRTSEIIEVEFPPRERTIVVDAQLKQLDELEQEVERDHREKMGAIRRKRAELAALTYAPASQECAA